MVLLKAVVLAAATLAAPQAVDASSPLHYFLARYYPSPPQPPAPAPPPQKTDDGDSVNAGDTHYKQGGKSRSGSGVSNAGSSGAFLQVHACVYSTDEESVSIACACGGCPLHLPILSKRHIFGSLSSV